MDKLKSTTRVPLAIERADVQASLIAIDEQANDLFYGTMLNIEQGVEESLDMFETMENQIRNTGFSVDLENLKQQAIYNKDLEQQIFLENVVEDPTLDNETKKDILRQEVLMGPSSTLKTLYLDRLYQSRMVDPDLEDEDLVDIDLKINNTKLLSTLSQVMPKVTTTMMTSPIPNEVDIQILEAATNPELHKDPGLWTKIVREPLVILQAIPLIFPYLRELYLTSKTALTDGVDSNITAIRPIARAQAQKESGEWLINEYEKFTKFFGVSLEDLEEAYATKLFTTLEEGFDWIAKKVNPDDPEAFKVATEILTLIAGPVLAKRRAYKQAIAEELAVTDAMGAKISTKAPSKQKPTKVDTTNNPEADIESTNLDKDLTLPDDNVLVETTNSNPEVAKDLAELIIIDETEQVAAKLKVPLAQFIYDMFIPKLTDKGGKYFESLDGFTPYKDLVAQQFRDSVDIVFNRHLVDQEGRYNFVLSKVEVLNELNKLDPANRIDLSPSLSSFVPTETEIVSSLAFTKGGVAWTSPTKAIDAAVQLNKLIEAKKLDNPGAIIIESKGPNGGTVWSGDIKSFRQKMLGKELPNNYVVYWRRKGNFLDEVKQATEGFGKTQHEDSNALVRHLFNTRKLWNWFTVFGKFTKEFETKTMLSGLRAERMGKDQLRTLMQTLPRYSKQFRSDLLKLMDESNANRGLKRDVFTTKEINDIIGYNAKADHLVKLQQTLIMMRQIDKWSWTNVNQLRIQEFKQLGYQGYLDLNATPDGAISRIMTKEEFAFPLGKTKDGKEIITDVELIWDAEANAPVRFKPNEANKGTVKQYLYDDNNLPERQIVALAEDFVVEGKRYKYAVLPKTMKYQAQTPEWIVPYEIGHFPLLSEGNFFLRLYPQTVTVNGIVRGAKVPAQTHNQYGRTVAMFDTESQFKEMREKGQLPKDIADQLDAGQEGINWTLSQAEEFKVGDIIDAYRVRKGAGNSAKARTERMFNGIYADPLESFILSTQRLGYDLYTRPVIEQLKLQWLAKYDGKILRVDKIDPDVPDWRQSNRDIVLKTDKFPALETQIRMNPGTPSKMSKQALAEWDRIQMMEYGGVGNAAAYYTYATAGWLAEVTDHKYTSMLSSVFRKAQRSPEQIVNYPLRVVSTLKIILAGLWRNITLQPIGIVGPLLVGPNSGRAIANTMRVVTHRVIDRKSFRDYKPGYIKAMEQMYDRGDLFANTGFQLRKGDIMNADDVALVLKELDASGYGIVADHILAQGFFSATPERLRTRMIPGQTALERLARDGLAWYSKAGFELGEYINRVGMWMASRERWISQNKGKNWRTRKSLDEITEEAWKLSGSMNKQATYAFQRTPLLQYIGQFQAFGMKASENLWNSSATPYSAKQRGALMAYNAIVWGPRAGFIYGIGELIEQYLEANGMQDVARNLDDMALINVAFRMYMDSAYPSFLEEGTPINSSFDIPVVYAPFGPDFGGVYRSFIKWLIVGAGGDVENYSMGPTLQVVRKMYDSVDLMYEMYANQAYTNTERIQRGAELLFRLTSGGNSILNYFMYTPNNEQYNEIGQIKSHMTHGDRFFQLFSVPNKTVVNAYKAFKDLKSEDERAAYEAKIIVKNLFWQKGVDLKLQDIKDVIYTYNAKRQDDPEYTDVYQNKLWEEVVKLEHQRAKTMGESMFDRVIVEALALKPQSEIPDFLKGAFDSLQDPKFNPDHQPSMNYILQILKEGHERGKQ